MLNKKQFKHIKSNKFLVELVKNVARRHFHHLKVLKIIGGLHYVPEMTSTSKISLTWRYATNDVVKNTRFRSLLVTLGQQLLL